MDEFFSTSLCRSAEKVASIRWMRQLVLGDMSELRALRVLSPSKKDAMLAGERRTD